MSDNSKTLLSVVVPIYNEAAGLREFNEALIKEIQKVTPSYEIIYCDDGSTDDTAKIIRDLHTKNPGVKLIKFSRNFGKENALSAGIAQASGESIMMLDGDGQHPVELLPEFMRAWKGGSKVVVGVRTSNSSEGWFKHASSRLFYKTFNRLTGEHLIPGSTDFRLIDRSVAQEFLRLSESDRITRGLIDWLGFSRSYVHFKANPRSQGSAAYSRRKLVRLATHTFVSLTPVPLYLFGYLGLFITGGSLLLGGSVLIEQVFLGDPWYWNFTGTAMVGILLLFLIGLVLLSQGMLSLYISHIHSQTKQRPLYIIDYDGSAGIRKV